MDWVWIRPVIKPVRPRDIEDLSSPARRVLQCLETRFLVRNGNPVCIASASSYQPRRQDQPIPFFGVTVVPQSQDRNIFRAIHQGALTAVGPGESVLRSGRCNVEEYPSSHFPHFQNGLPNIPDLHQVFPSTQLSQQRQEGVFVPRNIVTNLDTKSAEENKGGTRREHESDDENVSCIDISMELGNYADCNNSPPISNYDPVDDKSMNSFLSMSPKNNPPISNYDTFDEDFISNLSPGNNTSEPLSQDRNIFRVISLGEPDAFSQNEPLFKIDHCENAKKYPSSVNSEEKWDFVRPNILKNMETNLQQKSTEENNGIVRQPEACGLNKENPSPLDISMELRYLTDPNNTPPKKPSNSFSSISPDIFSNHEEAFGSFLNDSITCPKPVSNSTEAAEDDKENCSRSGSDRLDNNDNFTDNINNILSKKKMGNNVASFNGSPFNDITPRRNEMNSSYGKTNNNEESLPFVKGKTSSGCESPQISRRQLGAKPLTLSVQSSTSVKMLCIGSAPALSPQTGKEPTGSNLADIFDISDTSGQKKTSDEKTLQYSVVAKSPNMADNQLFNVPITPGSKNGKKFLGTPFQRALSSNCLTSKAYSEETPLPKIPEKSSHHIRESNEDDSIETEKTSSTIGQNIEFCPLFQTEIPNEAVLKDPQPPALFPIFIGQSKRKNDKIEDTLSQSSTSSKKRIKFMVPYKKNDDVKPPTSHKDIQALSIKLATEINSRKQKIQKLNEILSHDISERIKSDSPEELSMTLQYRGGFCQLNRSNTSETMLPENIVVRIMWSSDIKYISIPIQKYSWCSELVKNVFTNKTRKVCFEAQEMIQLIVEKFNFSPSEVSSQWLILDPLIGCWLLNPDEPPQSFKNVLTMMKISEEMEGIENLLSKLSECAKVLYEHLTKFGLWKLFLHIEMRVTPILACMELHGIQVDVKKFQEMGTLLKLRLEDVQKMAHKAAGRQFQLTSPQQLGNVLYDHLKLDVKHNISVKETDKKHNKSTSEPTLIKFKDVHPLPGVMLQFRRMHKLKTTYVDAILGHVTNGSIYTTWDQISAATGRITSSEPNLQTIPKQPLMPDQPDLQLRTGFVARNGYSFLAADFQHIELRVFAHLSKDTALIRALSQSTDVFKILSQQWLQIEDITKVTEEDRDKTKRIMYALMYGAGASKLVEFLQIDFNQANEILQRFSSTFSKMEDFKKSVVRDCRKQGYLVTETGRRRLFPNINSSNFQLRMHSERQAVNFLVQGTAADLCKCAMVQTQRYLTGIGSQRNIPQARLLLQIHDELLWEIPDCDVMDAADVVQEAMEGATSVFQSLSNFSVSLPVVMKIGKSWGGLKIVKNASLGLSSQQ